MGGAGRPANRAARAATTLRSSGATPLPCVPTGTRLPVHSCARAVVLDLALWAAAVRQAHRHAARPALRPRVLLQRPLPFRRAARCHMHMRLRPAVRTRRQPGRHGGHRIAVSCKGLRLAGVAAGQSARVPECQSARVPECPRSQRPGQTRHPRTPRACPHHSTCPHLLPPAPTCPHLPPPAPRSCAAGRPIIRRRRGDLRAVRSQDRLRLQLRPFRGAMPCHAMPCHAMPYHAMHPLVLVTWYARVFTDACLYLTTFPRTFQFMLATTLYFMGFTCFRLIAVTTRVSLSKFVS